MPKTPRFGMWFPTTSRRPKTFNKSPVLCNRLHRSISHNNSTNNSKNNSKSNSRRFPHINARSHLSGPHDAGDARQENSAGPEVDLSEWADSPGMAGNTRESFVGMVAAQLSSFVAAVSSKFKSPSERPSSVKMKGTVCKVNGDPGPVPMQTSPPDSTGAVGDVTTAAPPTFFPRQLSGLVSFLRRGKSSSYQRIQENTMSATAPKKLFPCPATIRLLQLLLSTIQCTPKVRLAGRKLLAREFEEAQCLASAVLTLALCWTRWCARIADTPR